MNDQNQETENAVVTGLPFPIILGVVFAVFGSVVTLATLAVSKLFGFEVNGGNVFLMVVGLLGLLTVVGLLGSAAENKDK